MPASLILTVFNEAESLPTLLADIAAQTASPTEVIFVDAGSTDGTHEVVDRWRTESGLDVRLEVRPGANISAGRNAAISLARNEVIAVTDAGTRLGPDWLRLLTLPLRDPDVHVVAGFFEPLGATWFESLLGAVITPTVDEVDPDTFLPSSRSIAFRKEVWHAAGGYPEWLDYCEDLILDLEMKKVSPDFAFAPGAVVGWNARPDLPSFVKQYYRYARGDGKAGLWRRRHGARYAAYGAWVGMAVAAVWNPWLWVPLGASLAVYHRKFVLRVARRWQTLGPRARLGSMIVPFLVVAGDAAKMVGYPVGLMWRARQGSPVIGAVHD